MEAKKLETSQTPTAKERLLRSISTLDGLGEVDSKIREKLTSEATLLQEIGTYLLNLGGKRMRPVLALMVGKAFGLTPPSQDLIHVAAGIELIHMATLLHDDIIDKSPVRRHKESAFIKYGVDNSLLAGDFLLTRAFSLCAHLDSFIIDETEKACIDLTEGEILEVPLYRALHTVDSYLTIARKKTASLFRLATISGTHLAGAGAQATEHMRRFGESLGLAFQILDDILDVTADENLLGKKSGMDLKERKPSIVNVLWLNSGNPLAKKLLLPPGAEEEEFCTAALKELKQSPVIEQASALAASYSADAEQALHSAAKSAKNVSLDVFDELQSVVDYTTRRLE